MATTPSKPLISQDLLDYLDFYWSAKRMTNLKTLEDFQKLQGALEIVEKLRTIFDEQMTG